MINTEGNIYKNAAQIIEIINAAFSEESDAVS